MSTEPVKVPILAESSDKNNILTNSGAGFFTVAAGFGLRLAQDLFPKREDFNGLANLLSKPIDWFCKGSYFVWDTTIASGDGYPIRAIVKKADNSGYWVNTVDNNATNPDTGGANWVSFSPDDLATINGYSLVSQSEAEDGIGTTIRWWNALRVHQAIAAWFVANVDSKSDLVRLDHTTYYDVNSDVWTDITDMSIAITVTNQPVLCEFSAIIMAFFEAAAYSTYFRALVSGGEYTDTVIDFTQRDGMGATSNITNPAILNKSISLTQNTTYTFKVQAKNSATAPLQNCRINASNDYLTSSDPGARSTLQLRVY